MYVCVSTAKENKLGMYNSRAYTHALLGEVLFFLSVMWSTHANHFIPQRRLVDAGQMASMYIEAVAWCERNFTWSHQESRNGRTAGGQSSFRNRSHRRNSLSSPPLLLKKEKEMYLFLLLSFRVIMSKHNRVHQSWPASRRNVAFGIYSQPKSA